MNNPRKYIIASIVVILLVAVAAPLAYFLILAPPHGSVPSSSTASSSQCKPILPGEKVKSQLKQESFGAVTKFLLPTPGRDPNAITIAPDGSVWFGEEAIPGVGHLYPNGTLIDYAWPGNYTSSSNNGLYSCSFKSDIWGIAIWNGRVWTSDASHNRLVGIDPSTGSVESIMLSANDSFPYTITVGPDSSLWFTELSASRIGRVFPNSTFVEYPLSINGLNEVPAEITFVNATLGYYVNIGAFQGSANASLFAFNPERFSPRQIVGGDALYAPDSVSTGNGGIWIDQHGPASMLFYDPLDKQFTTYPTSTINYTTTPLPYFVKANGSKIWFNEHYGNKIAVIDTAKGTLTEYAESSPPPINASQIDNALTFSLGKDKVWFTGWTGNYVGYVNATYNPPFSISAAGNSSLTIPRGTTANVTLTVSGESSSPLSIQFSDSESFGSQPKYIQMRSNSTHISSLSGAVSFTVSITPESILKPGNYTLLVTVTDGLIYRSVYLKLNAQ